MIKAQHVKAYPGYKLSISFSDGKEAMFDCSQLIQSGVFVRLLSQESLFLNPHIIDNGNAIARDEQIDIDARGCYEDLLAGNTIL